MKTFKQFIETIHDLDENLLSSVVKAAARQQLLRGLVQKQIGAAPRKLSLGTRVYHGTTQPSSRQIDRSGWRTDQNVTRQLTGSGVYVTPQRRVAQMYAGQRSAQRGESPAIRTLRIPQSIFDKAKQSRVDRGEWVYDKGGVKFNVLQMNPKAANKFDITKSTQGKVELKPSQKSELNQRVRTGLSKPQNRAELYKEIRGTRPSVRNGSQRAGNALDNATTQKNNQLSPIQQIRKLQPNNPSIRPGGYGIAGINPV
jgi:hypothetical protein